MSEEELAESQNFICKKICNQLKSCKKHKCKDACCPVQPGRPDPEGRHLCLLTCQKDLTCGKHKCNEFCHLGKCKPCRVFSSQPLYCPCGIAKVDPPVKCETQQPTCGGPCKQKLPCGHNCAIRCHPGPCPPCLEMVDK